jgi:hypothetical protein
MSSPIPSINRKELEERLMGFELGEDPDGMPVCLDQYEVAALLQLFDQYAKAYTQEQTGATTTLQPFEIQNYKRLLALEVRGINEYRKLREYPALTSERVVAFINQLSPWNLATTGISVLEAYAKAYAEETRETIRLEAQNDAVSKIYGIANDLASRDPAVIGSVSTAPYFANAVAIYKEYLQGDNYERINWKILNLPTLNQSNQEPQL